MKTAFLAAAALIASASIVSAPVPYLPVPKDAAVILNTGSTNAQGYRIVLQRSGDAEFVWGARRSTATIDKAIATKFFADATLGMPLSKLQVAPCMKSASFGTSTFVWWRGQRSPDLSCPTGARSALLGDDAISIAQALKVGNVQRAHVQIYLPTGEPRKPIPTPSPG